MSAGELGFGAWVLLAIGAVTVGIGKTAMPGATTVAVAIFASVLPARNSTAVLLVLLLVGDVFALLAYRRHADWPTLLRLAPAVVTGLVVGALFLAFANDGGVRRVIGVILLALIALTLWQRRRGAASIPGERSRHAAGTDADTASRDRSRPVPAARTAATVGYGAAAGFTTMVANAGGPAMSMYFLAARFPVKAFLGTAAWFFAMINVAKLPFAIGIGLLTPAGLLIDLLLVPGVLVGALIGIRAAGRMSQQLFERIVIVLTILGAVYLLVG
ncbi:sulfite exporter TauE/SafE family protein [Microbacterium limosum]|uniref:Probable membrane transporter protein n=1 Tax=Microbacterium limosum TaxID=3079935 RepID=A0AAU0MG92_9MICO|nr:sulfite exporter TauE/SafE family protein [Microbacterium sp. Y20]WOQ69210.1 sulfite exporter TauE/SafE family protein [Microbacterium sp. Y20]